MINDYWYFMMVYIYIWFMTSISFYKVIVTDPGIIPRRAILECKKDVPRFYLDEKIEIEKNVDG